MNFSPTVRCLALMMLILCAPAARAAIDVFTCEPEWGALVQALAGDRARVYTATTALQDPHQVQARPSLIAKLRRADLVVCTGAELEIGWMPVLLRQAGNPRVQPGQRGYLAASEYVRMLDRPVRLDRAEGDVHPYGNPHIQTDPRNIQRVADAVAQRLALLDPDNTAYYEARYQDFQKRWQAAIRHWEQEAASLRGIPIAVQHKGWVYMINWLGLTEITALEPKPGIPPSGAHLAEVLEQLQSRPAKMIIRAAYQDGRPSRWLSQRAGIPAVELAFTVGGTPQAKDLFGLFDDTVQRLLRAVQ